MNIRWTVWQMPCRHVVCVADTPGLSWRLARPITDRWAYRTRKIKCLIWLRRYLIRLNPTYWLGHGFQSLPDYTWLFYCATRTPLLAPWRRGVFSHADSRTHDQGTESTVCGPSGTLANEQGSQIMGRDKGPVFKDQVHRDRKGSNPTSNQSINKRIPYTLTHPSAFEIIHITLCVRLGLPSSTFGPNSSEQ